MYWLPRLLVRIRIAFLNETVRPWLSVTRPSSSTCSRTLNTSACAFSTCVCTHKRVSFIEVRRRLERESQKRRPALAASSALHVAKIETKNSENNIPHAARKKKNVTEKKKSDTDMTWYTDIRISHLVEEDDRVGPPPHRLRQLPALVVPNVPME
jgi:hypothetical protein